MAARLEVSVDGGGLDASLSPQGDLITTAIGLVEALQKGSVPGLADFVARIAALDVPVQGGGQGAATALGQARAALPADTGAATADALAEIARFAVQAGGTLLPILEKVTAAARAIETLARIDLRCAQPLVAAPVQVQAAAPATRGVSRRPQRGMRARAPVAPRR